MNENKEVIKEIEKQIAHKTKKQNKAISFIKENLSKFLLIPIALIYILYGLFSITKKDASLIAILGSIAAGLITGTIIYINMMNAGINDAKKTDDYKLANKAFDDEKEAIAEYQNKLPAFCTMKQKNEIIEAQRVILQCAMLDYKAWKYGYYENKEDLSLEQKAALEKVKKIHIEPLKANDLLNRDTSNRKRREKYGRYGRSKSDYLSGKTFKSITWTLVMAIVFGYYGLAPFIINDDTIAQLVWNTFQIIMWLGMGVLKYIEAKSFVIDEYLENNIVVKTMYLKEFKAIMKTDPVSLDSYETDADREIKEFIKRKEAEENGN